MTAPPEPALAPMPEPLTEPGARGWDETPAEAARFDLWWGDRDINRDED